MARAQEGGTRPSAWYEGFEGPQVSWRVLGGDAQYRVEFHARVRDEAHTGQWCERLRILGNGGTEVFVAHEVGRPRIIDELLPTVWVKANRQGIQMAVQVVLPRTTDPATRRPMSTVLYGTTYTMAGRWHQLRVDDLPRQLARQTRVLRARFGPNVDAREAYVERVLLNVYGGPGVTDVWIDDLDVAGHVGPPGSEVVPSTPAPWGPDTRPGSPDASAGGGPSGLATASRQGVRLSGSILWVDDRPLFPRIIQYQGEPLALLRQLGFNTIWLPQLPTTEMLEEAGRLGLWIVCPPPYPPRPEDQADAADSPSPEIGPAFDRVLAWDLGSGLGAQHLAATTAWAKQIKAADRRCPGRPLVCRPTSRLRDYSRAVDLVLLGRPSLGTSLELGQYSAWIRQRPRLLLPGTPFWTTVETQPAESLRRQWAGLGVGEAAPTSFSPEQVRLLVYTAVMSGSRGLWFESLSPLGATDPQTRTRSLTLELLNLELDLMEPWAAAGRVLATVPSESGVTATLLHTEHGRLLVPVWITPQSQCVVAQGAGHGIAFMVPGVPETNKGYFMLPGELRPFQPPRKAGGIRVVIDELDLTATVLLTQHPMVVSAMTARARQTGPRAAEIQRELAAIKLESVAALAGRLAGPNPQVPQAGQWLAAARKHLQQSDNYLAARNHPAAYLEAQRARRPLRLLERAHWEAAAASLRSPVASPAAVSFATLPWHWNLLEHVASSAAGPNLLAAGDFEDLPFLFASGWQHLQYPIPGVHAEAELSPGAAHTGRLGLRISARQAEPGDPPVLESPPVWFTSPPVPVEAGQLLRIQGWVNVPSPMGGSVDGLLVVDSLGGEVLAERIQRTNGWEQFTLYRVATQSGPVSLTVALSGLGDAMVDDVTLQVLQPPAATPVAAASCPR